MVVSGRSNVLPISWHQLDLHEVALHYRNARGRVEIENLGDAHHEDSTPLRWRQLKLRDSILEETHAALELGVLLGELIDVVQERGLASKRLPDELRRDQGLRSRNFGITDDRDGRFVTIALSKRGQGLIAELERVRQDAERRLGAPLPIVNPPPLGKRVGSPFH